MNDDLGEESQCDNAKLNKCKVKAGKSLCWNN